MSYLVLDIETVPDVVVWEPPARLPERIKGPKEKPTKGDLTFYRLLGEALDKGEGVHPEDLDKGLKLADLIEEPTAANGEAVLSMKAKIAGLMAPIEDDKPFPPIYAHRPVAIGFLLLDDNLTIQQFGCPTDASMSAAGERNMLTQISAFLDQQRPTIVGWNTRGFDLPVLNMRSLRRGVTQRWYNNEYRARYKDDSHIDLKDILSEFGTVSNGRGSFSLDSIAKTVGLPGKWGDMDGSKVAEMFKAGNIDQIQVYCLSDVAQTAFVFFRWMLVRGRINLAQYKVAASALFAHIKAMAATTVPAFGEFVALIDELGLLLEDP